MRKRTVFLPEMELLFDGIDADIEVVVEEVVVGAVGTVGSAKDLGARGREGGVGVLREGGLGLGDGLGLGEDGQGYGEEG